MTQDEMILNLLRAMARSMVCEKCGGIGKISEYVVEFQHNRTIDCSCRTAIRDLLKPQGV